MTTYVAVAALLLAYVALVAAFLALRTLARLRRATAIIARGSRGPAGQASLVEATQHNTEQVEVLTEELADLRGLVADDRKAAPRARAAGSTQGALRNVALVRYDALREMSGRMSFSLALLDEQGDGVTISAIATAGDTRVYAKGVADGKGEHELTPEESQAVAAALDKRRGLLRRKAG